jgi:hypothetical protein
MLKHWKTTVVGLFIGFGNFLLTGMGWKQAVISVAVATLGTVAADPKKNTTNTTTQQQSK